MPARFDRRRARRRGIHIDACPGADTAVGSQAVSTCLVPNQFLFRRETCCWSFAESPLCLQECCTESSAQRKRAADAVRSHPSPSPPERKISWFQALHSIESG